MNRFATYALLGALLGSASAAHAAINVPVLSGGVGENSRNAIQDAQSDFSLKVVFTGKQGIYLSDVNVQILDAAGNVVVSNVTQGPILLAGLTPGRYTLQANVDGHMQRQNFAIGHGGLKTLYVRFPVSDDNGGDYLHENL